MMKTENYWRGRFEDLEKAANNYALETYQEIEPVFIKAQREIQGEINSWYARIAKNNKVSIEEARRLLNANELKEFRWDVNEYIKYGKENAINQKWMKELENASAKWHISRLEALKVRTQQSLEVAFGNELDRVGEMARHVASDSYYKSIYEVHKGINVGWDIGQLDDRQIEKVVTKPWASDGKNFSDRIWQRKEQMINELHKELTRSVVLGKAPDEAIEQMMKFVNREVKNARSAAARLVKTEQAYIQSVSQKEAFEELGIEEYEVVATLDSITSEICREMDGKHFPTSEYEPGVTAHPFHPNCRSCTAPYFDDEWSKVGERAARDEDGETSYVPSNMTYKEWEKKYVDNNQLSNHEEAAANSYISSDSHMLNAALRIGSELTKRQEALSYEEKAALNRYIGPESYTLNAALRDGAELTTQQKALIENLDSALDKMPHYTGDLSRSLHFYSEESAKAFVEQYKPDKTIKHKEYLSTTKGETYNPDGQVQITIVGAHSGRDISSFNKSEQEVLYKRNSIFNVINVEKRNGKWYIFLEEVGQDERGT